jgi:SAM-dependent methyltransferase
MSYASILRQVDRYYSDKLQVHGATARGVDWNSPESQRMRFDQLLKICDGRELVGINDYGCGYGALADHLRENGYAFRYCGFDISGPMIAKAKALHSAESQVTFVSEESGLTQADYTVASGIFNVKLQTPTAEWEGYMLQTLETINRLSSKGFAFNVLTKYSDPDLMRPDLYYADPLFCFDYCKGKFSRLVSLVHDYPLFEFTILVRKE